MAKKPRKSKYLLSKLEEDIALLHKHTFKHPDMDEQRKALLADFIRLPKLSTYQKNAVHKLAKIPKAQAKRLKVDRRRKKHYVYAISDGAFVKIGLAVDPQKRLGDLQVANPSALKLEAKIECNRYSEASKLEKQLHRACKRHHVRGEWFEMDAMCVFDTYI